MTSASGILVRSITFLAAVLWAAGCGDPAEPNQVPGAVGSIPAQSVFVGDTVAIVVSRYFSDPDGDALSYQAQSSDVGVVTVTVSSDTVRVVGIGRGSATVTVSAGDLRICGRESSFAYLVQSAQSRDYPVPLVADKRALLRVFVTATRKTSETIPPGRARFYLNGSETYTVTIPGKAGTIPTEVDEGSLDKSSNATIPARVVRSRLRWSSRSRKIGAGQGCRGRGPPDALEPRRARRGAHLGRGVSAA